MRYDINIESIKIINTGNNGTAEDAGYRAQHFIHELERRDQDKGLDPLATKYAIFIAAQESRINHVFDAVESKSIPVEYAATEITQANEEINKAWQSVLTRIKNKPGMDTYLNSALTVLRTYGSVVASQETFEILFQWAEKKISDQMGLQNALLEQDQKSKKLREANDIQSGFYQRTVEQIFSLDNRDDIRNALNNLVDVANRDSESSIKFNIYEALNEYYCEYIKDDDTADPYIAYHLLSILGPEPFVTSSGIPVINGQLANCTNFDFILDLRREKIKQLRQRQ
jgi:hypothetical protein